MNHFVYALTHPDVPGMGVLYVGSDLLDGNRIDKHRAGETSVVSKGCARFGLDPAKLECHVLEFWETSSPEYGWIKTMRAFGQGEFNKRAPYAFSTEANRRGGRIGALRQRALYGNPGTREGRSRGGRNGGPQGGHNQPREAKAKGGRTSASTGKANCSRWHGRQKDGPLCPKCRARQRTAE